MRVVAVVGEACIGVGKGRRVNRETHAMRSFTFGESRADEVHPIVLNNIDREARLMMDAA